MRIPRTSCLLLLAALASCDKEHTSATIEPGIDGDPGAVVLAPGASSSIAPASISVHALTRVGADADGKPAILLHLDVKDQFGQSIKALGRVHVELYKPATGDVAAAEPPGSPAFDNSHIQAQDRAWDADLRNPARNAQMFDDLVTRTYTIPLGGLPDWIIEWSKGSGNAAPTITVAFTFTDAQGGQQALRAGSRLSR